MRRILLALWLLLPVGFMAYHYGPGQDRMLLDEVAQAVSQAELAVHNKSWQQALGHYDAALAKLPEGQTQRSRELRLERAKVSMLASHLPQAHDELESLLEDIKNDPKTSSELLKETRQSLASAKFYMTWLMRLEGQSRDLWEPMIEGARQNYRLLAEANQDTGKNSGKKSGENSGEKSKQDLEASIRLARMDLNDLQGLPLPSQ